MAAARTANLSSQEIISEAKPDSTDLRSFIEKVRQEFPEDVLTIKRNGSSLRNRDPGGQAGAGEAVSHPAL